MDKASNLFSKLVKRTNQLPNNVKKLTKNLALLTMTKSKKGEQLLRNTFPGFDETSIKYFQDEAVKKLIKPTKVYASAVAQGLALPTAGALGAIGTAKIIKERNNNE